MLIPLSWLKDYVDIDVTPRELEEKLFSCGFEVEELREVGGEISNVVVGLVEECEPIPETHLHVCRVNGGAHGVFQVCCGADNSDSKSSFILSIPYLSIATRSIPMPKASPLYSSESMPQFSSTFLLTMPAPRISIQPS